MADIDKINKLKVTRSRQAGWVTRTIDQFDDNKNSPAALKMLSDRITSQLKKLQVAHDNYLSAIDEDDELIEDAETSFNDYFTKGTQCLRDIEDRIKEIKAQHLSTAADSNPVTYEDEALSNAPLSMIASTSANVSTLSPLATSDSATSMSVTIPESTFSTVSTASTSLVSSLAISTASSDTPPARLPQVQNMSSNNDGGGNFVARSTGNVEVTNSIDSWIDQLVVGRETVIDVPSSSDDFNQAIARLQIERDLPKVDLPVFDGSALAWPQFVEQFFMQVHSRPGLNDTRRMDLLQSHVKGEAKGLINGLGYTGRNYALAWKELKFAFGHRVSVVKAYIDMITVGNALPSSDAYALRNFYVAVRDCIATLRQMCYTSELTSLDVLQRTLRRIPGDKRVKWNDYVRNICRVREPTLVDLEHWLKDCIESEFNPYAISIRQRQSMQPSLSPSPRYTTLNTAMDSSSDMLQSAICVICAADHPIFKCEEYLTLTPEERYNCVKQHQLCFNCLHQKHRIAECKSKNLCKVSGCGAKHHTTLHRRRPPSSTLTNVVGQVNNTHHRLNQTYFQVLPVVVQGKNGRTLNTFALLDSCSDITLINTELAKDLGLRGKTEYLTLNTLSSPISLTSSRVGVSVRARSDPNAAALWIKEAWTHPGVFKCPSIRASDLENMKHLCGIGVCDVEPSEVKLLIGANVPRAHLQLDSREGPADGPVAVRTILGWCVIGGSNDGSMDEIQANVNFVMSEDMQLNRQVEKFWMTESFGVTTNMKKPMSMEDQRAVRILKDGTKLNGGKYEVPMLWRDKDQELPCNRSMAEKRFSSLVKRLSANPEMKNKYSEVVNCYIINGYARKLTPTEEKVEPKKTWYLPHHYVTNPNKPNKLRVVFDAAAKLNDVSLNSELLTGPDLTNNLFTVLQHFRLHPVAVVADIKEMFHQVKVAPSDSDALRFLWKDDIGITGPPQVYKMLVHIFGAKDSPCCANYALRQAAGEQVSESVRKTILHNFYVDDMLKSVKDVPTAIALIDDISSVLANNGFELAKWMSSSQEVLDHISQSLSTPAELNLDLEDLPIQRVLGLGWNVREDCFVFNPSSYSSVMTKRSIISMVSSIYDPCGFLTPFTFRAKCLIQEVWRSGTDWDEAVSHDIQQQWKDWLEELQHFASLRIPRYHGLKEGMNIELHIFSDASESGFAAVAYIRMQDSSGITCSFVAGRSHVAPIKQTLTIPKLELQGAVMAVRLSSALMDTFAASRIIFWTDAITVLRYINNESKRWKIFIANRVCEIREHTDPHQWRYIPSAQNPADDATRGLPAIVLSQANRWISGPSFLWQMEDSWPSQPEVSSPRKDDEGLQKIAVCMHVTGGLVNGTQNLHLEFIEPEKFSSWYRLCRLVAWIQRAALNFTAGISSKKIVPIQNKYLLSTELYNAEISLARVAQIQYFNREYGLLQQGSSIDVKSPVRPLDPFFDASCGIIRVGGRLSRTEDEREFKHQILLPYKHHVTRLIATDIHIKQAHCGPEHLIASLRQRFWPIKCRQLAKKVLHSCLDCHRRSVQPVVPKMADLPFQRVAAHTRPFQFTGLDYFGPMIVKRARSRVKKWGCIFTCLVTRAVHLELADSLQTDDFILVLRCFVSRRGQPSEIFSDNGTNFKGADREIQDSLKQLDQTKINHFLLQGFTKWHFIPPHAPHFGGAWERLVKSAKTALQAVLKTQVVTESVLRTTLAEVEAVLNSRPLTYNSSSVNDYTALTPNHFLHGGASSSNLVGEFAVQEIDSRKRWRQSQVIADHVWRRWQREYLPSLTVRNKWKADQRNLQVNDLVMLVDENLPRGQWMLGRVVELYPSRDERIRSIKVKTSQGTYTRPASKICLLEEGLKAKC